MILSIQVNDFGNTDYLSSIPVNDFVIFKNLGRSEGDIKDSIKIPPALDKLLIGTLLKRGEAPPSCVIMEKNVEWGSGIKSWTTLPSCLPIRIVFQRFQQSLWLKNSKKIPEKHIQKAKAGIYILTSNLKRFRSFSGKCVRFFSWSVSGLFPKWFWNKAEKTPETDRKKRKHFPEKERYLLSFKVRPFPSLLGGGSENFSKNREDFEGGLNKNPQNREEFLEIYLDLPPWAF